MEIAVLFLLLMKRPSGRADTMLPSASTPHHTSVVMDWLYPHAKMAHAIPASL